MAIDTIRRCMCSGQWETSVIMIKGFGCIPSRMAGKTGWAIIGVPGYTIVLIVRFRVHMASGAGKLHIVSRVHMAVYTLIPFALMLATVDREVLPIMIKGGWLPGGLRVASDAISGELQCFMVRIGRLIIIRLVAAGTCIGRIVIVPLVAGRTIVGDEGMRTI